MIFTETPLAGAYIIEIEPRGDERGFFARTLCRREFDAHGLNANFVQQSVSRNPRKGTLRGLHFQRAPHEEEKLVRVTSGRIFDVIVDTRPASVSFGQWFGLELSVENHRQIYIPKGFAHGFQTLESDTELLYQMTEYYDPSSSRGISWKDPQLRIDWPVKHTVFDPALMSQSDWLLPELRSISECLKQ